ncbi:MAG: CDF family Co(II)/Ni(II) efflux transporter DmeF [Candidatus Hydrogenedentes bacterium]|nr:CDF family Co(II)/Ni(II) efflux transporter DmeF [Candidatus Hydrogenedentota bacterium]
MVEQWLHEHTFGQAEVKPGEGRTRVVIVITALTMVVEVAAGLAFGSMALLADGLHMASHASALAISAFAYLYTRRHAKDERFSFGTGKVNSLAAFASAVLLAMFALVMASESVKRFLAPVTIEFNQAILVAFAGLIVNGVSLIILGGASSHDDHDHHHDHAHHHDHNLWSAYLHVLADALTSLLAIFALLAAKYLGLQWLDPMMGVVGAVLVIRWSWTLLGVSAKVLLDAQAPGRVRQAIRECIEARDDARVTDLHVWSVGPGIYAAEIVIVSERPGAADAYERLLPPNLGLVHVTVETHTSPTSAK